MKDINVLTWVFFASKGLTNYVDLMRAQMYIMECVKENATIESVKNSSGYMSCLNDLPNEMLTDEYIQEIIDFKI